VEIVQILNNTLAWDTSLKVELIDLVKVEEQDRAPLRP
jgi:plasmid rolling circle replication initiator protein Rep